MKSMLKNFQNVHNHFHFVSRSLRMRDHRLGGPEAQQRGLALQLRHQRVNAAGLYAKERRLRVLHTVLRHAQWTAA